METMLSRDEASIVLAHEVAETGRCLLARSPDDEELAAAAGALAESSS